MHWYVEDLIERIEDWLDTDDVYGFFKWKEADMIEYFIIIHNYGYNFTYFYGVVDIGDDKINFSLIKTEKFPETLKKAMAKEFDNFSPIAVAGNIFYLDYLFYVLYETGVMTAQEILDLLYKGKKYAEENNMEKELERIEEEIEYWKERIKT